MKLVGRVPKSALADGLPVRVPYPPYDVMVALVDGVARAIEDACNHGGASLSEGTLHGERIICPLHGYVFSVRTGELLAPRGLCDGQRTFETRDEGDMVAIYDPFAIVIG